MNAHRSVPRASMASVPPSCENLTLASCFVQYVLSVENLLFQSSYKVGCKGRSMCRPACHASLGTRHFSPNWCTSWWLSRAHRAQGHAAGSAAVTAARQIHRCSWWCCVSPHCTGSCGLQGAWMRRWMLLVMVAGCYCEQALYNCWIGKGSLEGTASLRCFVCVAGIQ